MNRLTENTFSYLFFSFILFSCSSEVVDKPKTIPPAQAEGIAYEPEIRTILETNCTFSNCHGNAVKPNWTSYETVWENRNKILQRVVVNQTMPPSGPLGPNTRAQIEAWINNCAPEETCTIDTNELAYVGVPGEGVNSLIEASCVTSGCHASNGSPDFQSYDSVFKYRAEISNLLNPCTSPDLSHASGIGLDFCDRMRIVLWVDSLSARQFKQ